MATDPPSRERIGGGYSKGQRAVETACVIAFALAELALTLRLAQAAWRWWLVPVGLCALALSALLADLISGLVHWGCDTWGSVETPVLGKAFIRQFREHHHDPEEINRHDLVETNGTNAGLALLPLAVVWALPLDLAAPTVIAWGLQLGGMGTAFFVTITSQAHKWAHAASVPAWVSLLQRAGLVLSKEHHDVHHLKPHLHNYCITGGWCDVVIERFGVFRGLEAMISRATGAQPRATDL